MKKLLALSLIALSLPLASFGEVRIVHRIHVNSFYHEGVQRPERTSTLEIWLGPARMVCLAPGLKIVVDSDRDLVTLVNDAAKTYAQAALGKPVLASMTPDDREATPDHEMKASVRETAGARIILGRSCRGYSIDIRSNLDHKITAWTSADVPFDLAAYRVLIGKLYRFLGRTDGSSIEALLSVDGYILAQENVADLKGETIRVNRDVIEIVEKTPPPGLFAVPAGYAKKPGLTHEDVDMIASILE